MFTIYFRYKTNVEWMFLIRTVSQHTVDALHYSLTSAHNDVKVEYEPLP